MKLDSWYKKRGFHFILERAQKLNERYSLTPQKAIARIEHCLQALESYECLPTFFVPGMVVQRNLSFIRSLQQHGCEIGVHGFNHVDLSAYPPENACRQLQRAVDLFHNNDLEVHGFRCPYLSVTDDLITSLPQGLFGYSSNRAVEWSFKGIKGKNESRLYDTIQGFYSPAKSETSLCVPWEQNGLVEIPVCTPDDLQLHDGAGFDLDQIVEAWLDILDQTYQRGEIFNLMFHPELAAFCEAPFVSVLRQVQPLQPKVWVTRLKDVGAWWKEKSAFQVEKIPENNGFSIHFLCTARATILCRNLEATTPSTPWAGSYGRLQGYSISIEGKQLPFVGLPSSPPAWVVPSLQRMGYIVETGESAQQCNLFLDNACLDGFGDPVSLIAFIERSNTPLIRFWPWPDGMRSALCITGDLDALSFFDYAIRLFIR